MHAWGSGRMGAIMHDIGERAVYQYHPYAMSTFSLKLWDLKGYQLNGKQQVAAN